MKKLVLALCLAATLTPMAAMALPGSKTQCSGGNALVYYYNSDGSVYKTVWIKAGAQGSEACV